MTLRAFLAVLVRRWWVLVPVLALTVAAAAGLVARTPADYQAQAAFVMLPPALDTTTGRVSNPYLAFDSSLRVTGDVLSQSVTDVTGVAEVARQGGTALYTVTAPTDTAGPEVVVAAHSGDEAATDTTIALVRTQLTDRLQRIQETAGAPKRTWITVSPLSTTPAKKQLKGAIRTAVVAGVVGVAVAVLLAFVVEGRARRRQDIRARARSGPGDFPHDHRDHFGTDATEDGVDFGHEFDRPARTLR